MKRMTPPVLVSHLIHLNILTCILTPSISSAVVLIWLDYTCTTAVCNPAGVLPDLEHLTPSTCLWRNNQCVGDEVLTSSRGGTSSTLKASRSPEVLWYVGLPHSSTWTLTGSMMDSAVSCSLPSRHENTWGTKDASVSKHSIHSMHSDVSWWRWHGQNTLMGFYYKQKR